MKRVLLTPLDWGLGHATRCIPMIRELKAHGCDVLIAGNGDALELLRQEFPSHRTFTLPAYAPRYPVSGSMVLSMVRQLPRFINVISSEHHAVDTIIEKENVDVIISDNRYGCWSDKIHSVLITHQSNVLMPKRFGILQGPVRKLSEHLMNRFHTCWIPDFPAGDSLAGELISFGDVNVKVQVEFIGWLSRFDPDNNQEKPTLDVVVILSGPEPQRTVFENILGPQLKASGLKFCVVRGLPSVNVLPEDNRFVNFLTSEDLQRCIAASAVVIARSGYSTVMDMHSLAKNAIFVPTPGQTEQEYLAERLMIKGIAFSMPQNKFNLSTAMTHSKKYTGFRPSGKNHLLGDAVRKLLNC